MARTLVLRVELPGAKELAEDIERAGLRVGGTLAGARREAADVIARAARPLTPRGPGPRGDALNPNDRLPHIADTLVGGWRGVESDHPGAVVLEEGRTIEPRGVPIRFEAARMAERASRAKVGQVEQIMADRMESLLGGIE